jgi:serine/threonine-protein kinase HipA
MFKELSVIIEGVYAGTVAVDRDGKHFFRYDDSYASTNTPLSTALPFGQESYSSKTIRYFLQGLLPDNERQLNQLGKMYHKSTPIGLLEDIGLDCAGAVQFTLPGEEHKAIDRPGSLEKLSDSELQYVMEELANWQGLKAPPRGVSLSLAGNQSKTAFRKIDDDWYWPSGSEPSSHIIKPGITHLDNQAFIEYIFQKLGTEIDLPMAQVDFEEIGGVSSIVVERYDRFEDEGTLRRVHQEDFCQALSIPPVNKYTENGGPSATKIIRHLRKNFNKDDIDTNIKDFTNGLLYNYFTGSPDGHAKNYSIMLSKNRILFAPLYDIASGFPYKNDKGRYLFDRAAMSIGGEKKFFRLRYSCLERFSKANSLNLDEVVDQAITMAKKIPPAWNKVLKDSERFPQINWLDERVTKLLERNCNEFLDTVDSRSSELSSNFGLGVSKNTSLGALKSDDVLDNSTENSVTFDSFSNNYNSSDIKGFSL